MAITPQDITEFAVTCTGKYVVNEYGIQNKQIWEHEPAPITATEQVSIFYDKPIVLGRYVDGGAIKPDIVVWDKVKKVAKVIEVTCPSDYGLNTAERKKISKYKDLKNDLRTTWELDDIEILPVVVGATGLIKDNFAEILKKIPGSPNVEETQL